MVRFGPLPRLLLRGIGFVSKRYFEGMIRHGRIQILLIIACNYGNIIMEEKEVDAMDVLRKEEIYTIEDIFALPDGERAELIDGKIYYMAPPTWKHQRISGYLHNQIYNYIRSNNGQCEVLAAPFAVFLKDDDINYLEPDISVICDLAKLDDSGCHGAPDWIIEIVSPSSKPRDYLTKLFQYRTAEVREYWIVDPDKRMTTVYSFEKDTVEQYAFGEDIPVGIYDGFSICIR